MVCFLSYTVNRFSDRFIIEAKINEQPSEAAEESSESVNVELENFEDGDDKVRRQGMNRLLADLDTVLRLKEILKT